MCAAESGGQPLRKGGTNMIGHISALGKGIKNTQRQATRGTAMLKTT